jgi:hypothetical protein
VRINIGPLPVKTIAAFMASSFQVGGCCPRLPLRLHNPWFRGYAPIVERVEKNTETSEVSGHCAWLELAAFRYEHTKR